jgi:ATP-binding cassette subfamily F protein uup
MSILCTLKNINLAFGTKILFKEAFLTLQKGEKVGLIGSNGKGKSSLFKILSSQLEPDRSSPPFSFDKAKVLKGIEGGFSVFLIPQEIPLLETDSITIKNFIFRFYPHLEKISHELDNIHHQLEQSKSNEITQRLIHKQKERLEEMEHHGGWQTIQLYESYLKYFGLLDLNKKVLNLSGGEKKKILLSLGLSSPSNLLLWDEPTNHLDLDTIKRFEEELSNINKTFLIISHDRYLLTKLTNKIIHIQNGQIDSFSGNYSDYLDHMEKEENDRMKLVEKLKNSLRRETEWMRQGIKARGCRSKKRVENFHKLSESLSDIKGRAKKALNLQVEDSKRKTKTLVELKNADLSFKDKELFANVSLTLKKGDKVGLIGPNGSGKTSLMKMIMGDITPSKGNVKKADAIKIQYFSQDRDELSPDKTPFEILGEGTDFITMPDGNNTHVSTYLKKFLFSQDDLHRPLKTFSGGERNRLQMALNLKQPGDIWIFDEPTNDLDLETIQVLEKELDNFGGSLILISHDRTFLSSVTNKVWLIQDNNIDFFSGGYDQVEPYLEALILEKQLLAQSESEDEVDDEIPSKSPSPHPKKIKMTNKEKMRFKVIQNEIEESEGILDKIQEELANFDYSSLNEEKSNQLSQLNENQMNLENKILELYEEFEDLQTKSP